MERNPHFGFLAAVPKAEVVGDKRGVSSALSFDLIGDERVVQILGRVGNDECLVFGRTRQEFQRIPWDAKTPGLCREGEPDMVGA